MDFNYQKICSSLIKNLPSRQKEIIKRRFGFKDKQRETLESIGKDFGLTRERIRQIEQVGLLSIGEKLKEHQEVFDYFLAEIKKYGGLKKEEALIFELGKGKFKNEIFFLLTLAKPFQRFSENEQFYSFWAINQKSVEKAKEIITNFYQKLKESNRLLKTEELEKSFSLSFEIINSYLEISKIIQKNSEGFYGLKDWPEINPKGIKNKAYIVFKKENKPLHFREVAKLIGPNALTQTVHNELMKDSRFVLVGRGIYALKEWGYEEGQVKDVILNILKKACRPMTKKEILEEVLKQRVIKESTVSLNLSNKQYFIKTSQGYLPKESIDFSFQYQIEKS